MSNGENNKLMSSMGVISVITNLAFTLWGTYCRLINCFSSFMMKLHVYWNVMPEYHMKINAYLQEHLGRVGWLVGWFVDWLVRWLFGLVWLVGWLVGWLIG